MAAQQRTRLLISLVAVFAFVSTASPQQKPAEQVARESREFRAAMAAHHICSGLWVVGRSTKRDPEEVVAQDLAPFKVFGWEPEFEYEVDHQRRTVTVTTPGAPPRTAKYNGDQGTTILPRGEKDVFYKPISVPEDAYWSAGFMGQVTLVIPSRDLVLVRMGPSPRNVYPYLNEVVGRILETLPESGSSKERQ